MIPGVPVVYGSTDVIIMSSSGIAIFCLSLLKLCISLKDSRAFRFAFALHIVSLVKNGILGNNVGLMIDRLMSKSILVFVAHYIAVIV